MVHYPKEIEYGSKYHDTYYEYRNVNLPKELKKKLTGNLLSEKEWRELGIILSKGWQHFMIYKKEPHVLLFRRPIGTDPQTGIVPPEIRIKIEEWEKVKDMYI